MGFLSANFWSRDFLRSCWKPSAKDFWGFWFCSYSTIPVAWETRTRQGEVAAQLPKNFSGQYLAGLHSHNHKLQLITMFLYITWRDTAHWILHQDILLVKRPIMDSTSCFCFVVVFVIVVSITFSSWRSPYEAAKKNLSAIVVTRFLEVFSVYY